MILVGTISLLVAAIACWPFAFVYKKPLPVMLLSYLFLLLIAAYDFWSTRKIHRATAPNAVLWHGLRRPDSVDSADLIDEMPTGKVLFFCAFPGLGLRRKHPSGHASLWLYLSAGLRDLGMENGDLGIEIFSDCALVGTSAVERC